MKIWIVSEYYYPIVTSTGYYITEIAEYLAEKGMEIHVICTGANYNEKEQIDVKRNEIYHGVYIHRVLTHNIDKNSFLKRLCRLIWASWCLFVKILLNIRKEDTLLVVTNPAFLLLFIPWVKKIKKIHYILLVHDICPENLVAIGQLKENSAIYRYLKQMFDKAYTKADMCISIGRDMSEIIKVKTQEKTPVIFIPNWADNDEVFPMDKKHTSMYQQVDTQGKFVFQFAGNLGHLQGLDNILSSITLIDNENLCFIFIGGGAKYNLIQEFSKTHQNVFAIGFQDRSLQNDFLNACDVAIVTLSDGMYGLGVPSKSYNIMAAGKPILFVGDMNSEIALCIKEHTLGWVVEPNSPETLKEAFELIYKQRDNLSLYQQNARNVATNIYSKQVILEKYYYLFLMQQM